ncbi:MAG: hypothetical protein Q9164_007392, partial [Protoblastenia rupestris]
MSTPMGIFVSGQLPALPSGELPNGTIQYKTSLCIENIKAILKEAGSDISQVVKVNAFITDMANFAAMNE